jgi:hypothetical protein
MERIYGSDSRAGMTKVTSWPDRLLRWTRRYPELELIFVV